MATPYATILTSIVLLFDVKFEKDTLALLAHAPNETFAPNETNEIFLLYTKL